jgi:hypothetical protein
MEYGIAKAIQALLFFGAAFGFGLWQLISVKREIRKDAERKQSEEPHQGTIAGSGGRAVFDRSRRLK